MRILRHAVTTLVLQQLVFVGRNTLYVIAVDAMQALRCLGDLSGVFIMHKLNTGVVDAGRPCTLPTPTNQYATVAFVAGVRGVGHAISLEDWHHRNQGFSMYFVTINFHLFHYLPRVHLFPDTILYGCNFASSYDTSTLQMSSLCT
jgi:hypothetical protein